METVNVVQFVDDRRDLGVKSGNYQRFRPAVKVRPSALVNSGAVP